VSKSKDLSTLANTAGVTPTRFQATSMGSALWWSNTMMLSPGVPAPRGPASTAFATLASAVFAALAFSRSAAMSACAKIAWVLLLALNNVACCGRL